MPAPDPKLETLLNGRHIATLGVTRPDGSIHQTSVWYLWEDGALWIPTSSEAAKAKHAISSGRASLMIDSRERGPLRGATTDGPVEVVGGEQAAALNRRIGFRYMSEEAMADPRVWEPMKVRDDITLKITPTRWYRWDMEEWFGGVLETPGYLLPLV
mgnify:CR=1 FL=1